MELKESLVLNVVLVALHDRAPCWIPCVFVYIWINAYIKLEVCK